MPLPSLPTQNPSAIFASWRPSFRSPRCRWKATKKEHRTQSQTLTGLGKWWGRKPLVLCRATILGVLLPATDNPQRDREVFLRLMTMDEEGLLRRRSTNMPVKELFRRLPAGEHARYFEAGSSEAKAKFLKGVSKEEKDKLQERVFLSMPYDERLEYCHRPEQIDGPSQEAWVAINAHLGTSACSLKELVAELGLRRFGHIPKVGDAFCGGGSIPFEAARLGCDTYASDLNPVAAMLTWASLNIVGGGEAVAQEVQCAQREVYDAVDRQITEWGIEHREPDPETGRRWRADAYLYCVEITCPECGWKVPLATTWVVGKGTDSIVSLVSNELNRRFEFKVEMHVAYERVIAAVAAATVVDSQLVCAHCSERTPIRSIRGDGRGTFGDNKSMLRPWTNADVAPCETDVFGERLFCIQWEDTWTDFDRNGEIRTVTKRHYQAPTSRDLERERTVLELLTERFDKWQQSGCIPRRMIEPGAKTNEPIRTRGWTHWHHLFTPRELLLLGLFNELASARKELAELVGCCLGLGRALNYLSRLSMWHAGAGNEKVDRVFVNQALNTYYSYSGRAWPGVEDNIVFDNTEAAVKGRNEVVSTDGRRVEAFCDLWITDPPYADAVSYEEVSEFFIAWYGPCASRAFPNWTMDSKRSLAVKGSDKSFAKSMVDCYGRMAEQMADNGFQVTAAWCIATEVGSAMKSGNYVQGTVLLILRKQTTEETAFLDEVYQEVETEVRRQLDSMQDLDDAKDPNFTDTDYQLAAYAAALRVLTAKKIEEIDVAYELSRTRKKGEKSLIEELIERAVKIACDHLVPQGLETHLWKSLTALERLFLKGLEMESHGERRSGVYQELARGFGVDEYTQLLAITKANETRLKTASEFGRRELGGETGFGPTLLRHALFAAHKTAETESPRDGITWLTTEAPDYRANRQRIIGLLEFLGTLCQNASLPHWHRDSEAATLLAGALRNRQDNV